MAVAALQKIVDSSKIKIIVRVDLNRFWESIVNRDAYDLKSRAWIINNTMETVQFYVYNSSDNIQLVQAQRIDAQPGEIIEVHGGIFQRRDEDLVVFRDNRGTGYNVKKNQLYGWNGSAMSQMKTPSTIESFRNQHHVGQFTRDRSSCCCTIN